jgi:hypothetical protein
MLRREKVLVELELAVSACRKTGAVFQQRICIDISMRNLGRVNFHPKKK